MPEAQAYAESLVTVPVPVDETERARARVAACALLGYAKDSSWSTVWPAIVQDAAFGCDVVTFVAMDRDRCAGVICGQHLTDEQLADLYIWIVRSFPHGGESYMPDGFVSPEEQVLEFRDRILERLKQHGACDAIRHLVQELPERDWLKWVLLEAETIARRDSWKPPQPEEILRLAADRQRRFVRNADELLEAVWESLQRMEAKLQDETPTAYRLWNEETQNRKKRVWPKDENRFSGEVKNHLKEDLKGRGVIVNREVVIRDGTGGESGERTDIHVDAVIKSPTGDMLDSVTVIIEAKGCWNNDLNEAMETQLVNRYLKDNRCQHGLYLVGWFNCDQWDEEDRKRRRPSSKTLLEACSLFEAQATALSQGGKHIRAFVMNTALR